MCNWTWECGREVPNAALCAELAKLGICAKGQKAESELMRDRFFIAAEMISIFTAKVWKGALERFW